MLGMFRHTTPRKDTGGVWKIVVFWESLECKMSWVFRLHPNNNILLTAGSTEHGKLFSEARSHAVGVFAQNSVRINELVDSGPTVVVLHSHYKKDRADWPSSATAIFEK